ncbi:MAG: AIPR family protein [Candidatus Pacebacteria bacterium]|nr:AIPR family protein [Candidatus Paceibacterota bacterium]
MTQVKISLPQVHNFRKIYDSEKGSMYAASCPIMSIYAVKDQMDKVVDINPRNQKGSSTPSKAMQETLKDSPESFVFRNRGLTFVVHDVVWDNKTDNLEMVFLINDSSDDQVNGLADGGHTYEVIKRFISETEESEQREIKAEVRLDIITGFDNNQDEIAEIVESRNTSTQVKDETLLDYKKVFDPVKKAIENKEYAKYIAYYENEYIDHNDPDSGYRPIGIASVLSCLMCLDVDVYNENQHPTSAYSSKKKVIEWFSNRAEKNPVDTANFCKILPQVLDLKDYIESQIPKIWNRVSARFGDQIGVKKMKNEKNLDYSDYTVDYIIPGGFVYPILSAFRGLLIKDKNGYSFKVNPKEIFDQMNSENGKTLIYKLINVENKDPQKMGKNPALYDSCYGALKGYYYELTSR